MYFTSLSILFYPKLLFWLYDSIVSYFLVSLSNFRGILRLENHLFLIFIVTSFLAGMASLIMTLPTLFDLQTHGEKLTEVTKFQTESSWYLDFFAKAIHWFLLTQQSMGPSQ